jgi:mercuric ion transport protein
MPLSPVKCTCAGGTGSILAAVCCFTPILTLALAGLGLGWFSSYLDWILFPLMALSLAVLAWGLWGLRRRKRMDKPSTVDT